MTKAQRKRLKIDEMLGHRFGSLTVVGLESLRTERNVAYYLCECDCGNKVVICGSTLRKKIPHYCHDCQMKALHEKTATHHQTNTTLYRIYYSMKNRCKTNKNYGGRGIKVCDEWENNFMSFYNWAMANGWKDKKTPKNYSSLTLDRIDVNGDYEPSNCRFVSMKTQQRNKRNNHLIEYGGKFKTITEWCEQFGLNRNTVYGQINHQKLTIKQIIERKQSI